jgi:hypothetical protein
MVWLRGTYNDRILGIAYQSIEDILEHISRGLEYRSSLEACWYGYARGRTVGEVRSIVFQGVESGWFLLLGSGLSGCSGAHGGAKIN